MKNKFKKSKIIVPALALITTTTVASVTGTVAWFTATKTVTANAGNFTATYNDGNLEVATTSVQASATGTGVLDALTIGDNQKDITINNGILFTDASYDAANDTMWSDTVNTDGTAPTAFENKGASTAAAAGWVYDSTNKTVLGVTWTYTFKYKFGSDFSKKVDLAFAPSISSMTSTDDSSFGGVAGGLRICMYTTVGTVIYAPSSASKFTYITKTDGTTSTYNTTVLSSNSTDSDSSYKLGTFIGTAANAYGKDDIAVRVVAWFEGTDTDHVLTEKTIATVNATLGFKVVTQNA